MWHQLLRDLVVTDMSGFMGQYLFQAKLRTAAQAKSESLKQDVVSLVARLDGLRRRRVKDEILIRRGRGGA